MREIKFRGISKTLKRFVYGSLDIIDKYPSIHTSNPNDWWDIIPETVGQFTGLLDKHQKEIYEGDVVLITEHYTQEVKEILGALVTMLMTRKYEVFWNKTKWSIKCLEEAVAIDPPIFDLPIENVSYEIIGNIHDKEQS